MNENELKLKFEKWMTLFHSDKLIFNPKFIETKDGKIIFGMKKHMGRLVVSIDKINSDLKERGIE
jgi:hypothetical protein